MSVFGVIAQEVAEVAPEAVYTAANVAEFAIITTGTIPTNGISTNRRYLRGNGRWVSTTAGTTTSWYIDTGTSTHNDIILPPVWTQDTGTQFITQVASTAVTYYVTGGDGLIVHPPYDEAAWERQRRDQAKQRSANIHRAKGAIKRSLKLIDNIGFGDDVRVFLNGDEIEVSHPGSIFKFILKKRSGSLIDRTISPGYSTPYHLQLYTKSDVHVADLCVYLKDTPVLDQVLAVAMFIKTGEEEDILEKANWFNHTRDQELKEIIANENPLYAKKLGMLKRDQDTGVFVSDFRDGIVIQNTISTVIASGQV